MSFRKNLLKRLKEPTPIYSRNETKPDLEGLLSENESVIFGLEKRDAYLKTYRTRWFLTEMKLVFIETEFPLEKTREIYFFEDISEMRLFEDEGVFVISSVAGEQGYDAETRLEQEFAKQAIEQYNRYTQAVQESERREDSTETE